MGEQEPKLHRAIPMNAAVIAPLFKIQATVAKDETGKLVVTNQFSEVVDHLTSEERDRREKVGEKIYRYVAGDRTAWDGEVQAHYEAEKERYLSDGPEAA